MRRYRVGAGGFSDRREAQREGEKRREKGRAERRG
jgi:hypothetical protein